MASTVPINVVFAPLPQGTCTPASGNALMTLLNAQVSADFATTGLTSYYNFGDSEPSAENRIYPWLRTIGGYPVGWFVYVDGSWQFVNRQRIWWCGTTGGAVNTMTATTVQDYYDTTSLHVGDVFVFAPNLTNTGAATLAINGFSALNIRIGGNAVEDGNLQQSQAHMVIYDGTNFQLLNPYIDDAPEYVTTGVTGTANALGVSPVIVASLSLTKPSGKDWSSVRITFQTFVMDNGGAGNRGIMDVDAQVGGVSLGLFSSSGSQPWTSANNDDNFSFTAVLEGPLTGFETTTPLNIDIVATIATGSAAGDEVAYRSAVATGIAQ